MHKFWQVVFAFFLKIFRYRSKILDKNLAIAFPNKKKELKNLKNKNL